MWTFLSSLSENEFFSSLLGRLAEFRGRHTEFLICSAGPYSGTMQPY